jgi:hypothetical protein
MTVYPPRENPFDLQEAIRAQIQPACQGCVAGAVCSLFPHAFRLLGYSGLSCQKQPPPEESVARLSPTTVAFHDPAYVTGDGDPSGGMDPADGVFIFVTKRGRGAAAEETCTLPSSLLATCTAVLNDFLSRVPIRR